MFLLHPAIFIWDIFVLLFISFSAASLIGSILLIRRRKLRLIGRISAKLIMLISFVATSILVYGSFIEPKIIVVTEEDIPLSLSQNITIAVISDIHIGPYSSKEYIERIVDKINHELPDFVFLVGDFVHTEDVSLEMLEPIQDLHASAGVFAVLGNHDQGRHARFFGKGYTGSDRSEQITSYLEGLGVRVLRNEHEVVSLGTEDLVISGIDDIWTGHSSVEDALDESPEKTTILLSHNPSVIDNKKSEAVDLIISGHTHGGQVRIPGLPLLRKIPISIDQSFDQGVFQLDGNRILAITRGIGETWTRFRLASWPEIMILRNK
ncbi:metallophosphoesterase [Candidatus Peregrinibacteria bacterium]|jgi:hypothetical protein|nr:metallophosphoesterase [Candidatus Peregrinibacteria bacterium]MBT3598516.1 metallophosphoesterase [Candidatus Peregrinibacteria bacterium]MBT4586088.1 metallophosphoesterase [Candidatus Peregrinibacteria bacterium]MBT6730338.1 metallophosphoesterase [Candidatus Peregrinibacteria bacterium]MBT7009032.1 metallophosphoesterase [Candidatus Peregrinibacteria bacterium]